MEHEPARSECKKVWSALSTTRDQAKLHVIGVTEEAALESTGEQTLRFLKESVDLTPKRSHVSELVPTNGGTSVTWAAAYVRHVLATNKNVIARNRQKLTARKRTMQRLRFFPS